MGLIQFYTFSFSFFLLLLGVESTCSTDENCNLNGICHNTTRSSICVCDEGWRGEDCGVLDVSPVERWTGYNHTNITSPDLYVNGSGNSSWGGHIVQDPSNPKLFHLIIAQFAKGCGLSGWRPFSVIIRAESQTGPRGPFTWKQQLFDTFHHNPTTIWSPADNKYLMYFIGKNVTAPDECGATTFPNLISVSSSHDLKTWDEPELLISNKTNPAPWPLWSPQNKTSAMLLGIESNNLYYAQNYSAPYKIAYKANNINRTEDPFLWRDKRGHWHILNHDMIDYFEDGGRRYPRVGGHAFARNWEGPWTYSNTIAFNTSVEFTDGTRTDYYRRERPKLYFSDDGNMTPLYLINGVQEFNQTGSYTLIQPIGSCWKNYERNLGFD
jgi:hypothetical protein